MRAGIKKSRDEIADQLVAEILSLPQDEQALRHHAIFFAHEDFQRPLKERRDSAFYEARIRLIKNRVPMRPPAFSVDDRRVFDAYLKAKGFLEDGHESLAAHLDPAFEVGRLIRISSTLAEGVRRLKLFKAYLDAGYVDVHHPHYLRYEPFKNQDPRAGGTLLMQAITRQEVSLVEVLIKAGAELKAVPPMDLTISGGQIIKKGDFISLYRSVLPAGSGASSLGGAFESLLERAGRAEIANDMSKSIDAAVVQPSSTKSPPAPTRRRSSL